MSAYIAACLQAILDGVYGRDVRQAIHDVLTWCATQISICATWIDDIGLTVVNGKIHLDYMKDAEPTAITTLVENIVEDIMDGSEPQPQPVPYRHGWFVDENGVLIYIP